MGAASGTLKCTAPVQTCGGHTGDVNCLALSEDKSRIASGSDDCTVRLWRVNDDVATVLSCEQILVGHAHYVNTVLFHRGKLLSGSADQTVKKWDPVSGQCLLTLNEHEDLITTILCSGNYIYSASNDKQAIQWCFDTGKPLVQFKGHTHQISAIAYFNQEHSSDPTQQTTTDHFGPRECVYTGSADRTAKAWSPRSGKCLLTFRGHTGAITQIRIGKTGKILYTCAIDGTARSWFVDDAKPQFVFEGHRSAIVCMELTGTMLYTGGNDRSAKSWLLESGSMVRSYAGAERTVNTVKQIGKSIITASNDGYVRFYTEFTGSLCAIYGNQDVGCCNAVEILDNYVITAVNDGEIHVWKRGEDSK